MSKWFEAENCKSFDYFLLCEDVAVINPLMDDVYALLQKKTRLNRAKLLPGEKPAFLVHLNCVLSNLIYQYEQNSPGCVFYSRTQKRYMKQGRLNPIGLELPIMVKVVDSLLNSKLIWHCKAYRAPYGKGLSSRMKVGRSLLTLFKQHGLSADLCSWHKDTETILINTKKTRIRKYEDSFGNEKSVKVQYTDLIDYPEDKYSEIYRKEITDYSKLLRQHIFKCFKGNNPKNLYKLPQSDFYRVKRIFRDDWRQGGRVYSSWNNKIRKKDRVNITIDGVKTHEYDYSGNHLKIIYASAVKSDFAEDPYKLEGFTDKIGRSLLKLLLLSVLNTDNQLSAVRALRDKVNGAKRFSPRENAVITTDKMNQKKFQNYCIKKNVNFDDLVAQFMELHNPIKEEFFNKSGLTLQRLDSDICIRIINEMTRLKKPVIQLFDSFICKDSDKDTLRRLMVKYHKQVLELNNIDINEERLIK